MTRGQFEPAAYPVDGWPYPEMSYFSDTVKINENTSLIAFPLGTPLNDWGAEGYHPAAAIGLGSNSSFLNTLKASGKVASRTWSFFWGRNGATSSTQLDGGMIFGGYDRAKTSGKGYTQALAPVTSTCGTGMVVTIVDMVLNFPNGTDASIFPKSRSASITVCIVPDYPALITLATDPFVVNFVTLTSMTVTPGRSLGLNYFDLRYPDGTSP